MAINFQQEYERLITKIKEWNANRLDLFEISYPNEKLDFFGVIRFFFQGEDLKYQSKCLRVSNRDNAAYLVSQLIQKFHPDLRMLTFDKYGLYESHALEDADRRLADSESPLIVQLNWAMDDREGKFILKNESKRNLGPELRPKFAGRNSFGSGSRLAGRSSTPGVMDNRHSVSETDLCAHSSPMTTSFTMEFSDNTATESSSSPFKRRWSTSKKKKTKPSDIINDANQQGQLSARPPESSFTRTLSNNEAVMRRRRQQKVESRTGQISADVTPRSIGDDWIKINGEKLDPKNPYKTLQVSSNVLVSKIVSMTLQAYGLDNALTKNYCLLQVHIDPNSKSKNHVVDIHRLRDSDCPLAILQKSPPSRGYYIFQIDKLNPNIPMRNKSIPSQEKSLPMTDNPTMVRSLTLNRATSKSRANNRMTSSAEFKTRSSVNETNQMFFPVDTKPDSLTTADNNFPRKPSNLAAQAIFFPDSRFEHLAPYLMEVYPDGRRKESSRVYRLTTLLSSSTLKVHHVPIISGKQLFYPIRIGSVARNVGPIPPGILLTANQKVSTQEAKNEIWPLHCTLQRSKDGAGLVQIIPAISESETAPQLRATAPMQVDGKDVNGPMSLLHGSLIRLGETGNYCFRYVDPTNELGPSPLHLPNTRKQYVTPQQQVAPPVSFGQYQTLHSDISTVPLNSSTNISNVSSSSHVNTNPHFQREALITSSSRVPVSSVNKDAQFILRNSMQIRSPNSDSLRRNKLSQVFPERTSNAIQAPLSKQTSFLLNSNNNVRQDHTFPITIECTPNQENQLFNEIIDKAQTLDRKKVNEKEFYLVPAYSIYCILRSVWNEETQRAPLQTCEKHIATMLSNITSRLTQVIQQSRNDASSLIFWLANVLELLHFLKRDEQLHSLRCLTAYEASLGSSIELAFHHLLETLKMEMNQYIPAFLNDEWVQEDESLVEWLNSTNQNITSLLGDDDEDNTLTSACLKRLIYCFHETMHMLHCCRVNTALTIQIFSQIFHHINQHLFNNFIHSGEDDHFTLNGNVCEKIRYRLACVKEWAKQHGLELAAGCHLQTIEQACCLVLLDKWNTDIRQLYDDIISLTSLNSLQVNYILTHCSNQSIPKEWLDIIVSGVREVADRMLQEEFGNSAELQIHVAERLSLPLLLPDEGYSMDIVTEQDNMAVYSKMKQLNQMGLLNNCLLNTNPRTTWKVHSTMATGSMGSKLSGNGSIEEPYENIGGEEFNQKESINNTTRQDTYMNTVEKRRGSINSSRNGSYQPQICEYVVKKINNSLGLGIIVATVPGDPGNGRGIYIRDIPPDGAAAKDGRLTRGDQILQIDDINLVDCDHQQAVCAMRTSGELVRIKVDKGAVQRKNIGYLVTMGPKQSTDKPDSKLDFTHLNNDRRKKASIPTNEPSKAVPSNQLVWTETDLDEGRMVKYRNSTTSSEPPNSNQHISSPMKSHTKVTEPSKRITEITSEWNNAKQNTSSGNKGRKKEFSNQKRVNGRETVGNNQRRDAIEDESDYTDDSDESTDESGASENGYGETKATPVISIHNHNRPPNTTAISNKKQNKETTPIEDVYAFPNKHSQQSQPPAIHYTPSQAVTEKFQSSSQYQSPKESNTPLGTPKRAPRPVPTFLASNLLSMDYKLDHNNAVSSPQSTMYNLENTSTLPNKSSNTQRYPAIDKVSGQSYSKRSDTTNESFKPNGYSFDKYQYISRELK